MSEISTDPTPPEVLGPATGVTDALLDDFDAWRAAAGETTDTLKRLADRCS